MATYDTAEIRRAAGVIRSSRDRVNSTVLTGLRRVEAEIEGEFCGQAAEALVDRLQSMDADARKMEGTLDNLYNVLLKFAQRMEEIDQELASQM